MKCILLVDLNTESQAACRLSCVESGWNCELFLQEMVYLPRRNYVESFLEHIVCGTSLYCLISCVQKHLQQLHGVGAAVTVTPELQAIFNCPLLTNLPIRINICMWIMLRV